MDPRGDSVVTSYHFEYGPTSAYGYRTPTSSIPGGAAREASADLDGLTPGVKYHYRLVAENAIGTSTGDHQVFPKESALAPGGGGSPPADLTASGTTTAWDNSAPNVTSYTLTNDPFVVGGRTPVFGSAATGRRHKKGTSFRYALSEAATEERHRLAPVGSPAGQALCRSDA